MFRKKLWIAPNSKLLFRQCLYILVKNIECNFLISLPERRILLTQETRKVVYSFFESESKRARLDEAGATSSTANQVAPEPICESPLVESLPVASLYSIGSDPVFSGLSPLGDLPNLEPSPLLDRSLEQATAPDLEARDALMESIHPWKVLE